MHEPVRRVFSVGGGKRSFRLVPDLSSLGAMMEPLSEEVKAKIMEAFHEARKQAFDATGLDVQKLFEKALDLIRVVKVTD